ncbi:MAG TPA: TadE/TadG family type IV pilus assembly protein [Candidatus Obscuribacterales bacterium]
MMTRSQHTNGNRTTGAAIVELACIAIVFVVFALLCVDAAVLIMASSVLDESVRDAGRAAAEMQTLSDAQKAADRAKDRHAKNNPMLKNLAVQVTKYESESDVGCIDSTSGTTGLTGCPGGQMSGTPSVQLKASVDAVVPAPILFFGASFGQGGTLHFEQVATFPIINIAPPTTLGVFDTPPAPQTTGGGGAYPCKVSLPSCGAANPSGGGTGGPSTTTTTTGSSPPPG